MNWDTAPADLEALRAQAVEYRNTIAHQAELLAAHKSEMQDWQRELLAAQQQVAELTKERDEALNGYAVRDDEVTGFVGMTKELRDQLAASQAREQKLRELTNALLRQIDIGTFVDDHGHSAKMLKATHDAMKLLTFPTDDTALQARLAEERERIVGAIRGISERAANYVRSMT